MIAGINMARVLENKPLLNLNYKTSIGSLASYVANPSVTSFVPMNANFGIFESFEGRTPKKSRKAMYAERALEELNILLKEIGD